MSRFAAGVFPERVNGGNERKNMRILAGKGGA